MYSLELIPPAAGGAYEIALIGFDSAFTPNRNLATGVAGPESVVSYDVDYEPGWGITLSPADTNGRVFLPLIQRN